MVAHVARLDLGRLPTTFRAAFWPKNEGVPGVRLNSTSSRPSAKHLPITFRPPSVSARCHDYRRKVVKRRWEGGSGPRSTQTRSRSARVHLPRRPFSKSSKVD